MTETKQTSTTKTDRRPDCVTEIRMGNSVLTVSGFFKQGATDTEDNSPISEYGKPFDICTYIIRLSFIENPNGSTVCNYDSAS